VATPTAPLKRFQDCECLCHRGVGAVHAWPCCDGYAPGKSKQKREHNRLRAVLRWIRGG